MVPEGDQVDVDLPPRGEEVAAPDVIAWMEGAASPPPTKEVVRDVNDKRKNYAWFVPPEPGVTDTKDTRELDTPIEIRRVCYHSLEELTPEAVYRAACRRQGVLAAEFVCTALQGTRLIVRNRQFTQREVKALAIALVKNPCVTTVDLEGNVLGAEGTGHLAEMLTQNQLITKLVLAENGLGSVGAQVMCSMLHDNRTLVSLDLSGNGFEESDGKYFARALQENTTLKELYLRHNRFRERGGELIARGLERNTTLEVLDLSWNHLRLTGARAICTALQTNSTLRVLNLSYNGASADGCLPLAEALTVNKGLEELELSNNRIHAAALEHLLKGLSTNTVLTTLKLGHNPLTAPSATAIIRVLAACPKSAVSELDLTHIPVDAEFLAEVSGLQKERPFHVTHDRIHYQNDRIRLEQTLEALRQDPLLTLSQLVKKPHVTHLVDVTFDPDTEGQLSDSVRHEVAHGILTVTIPVTAAIMEKLRKKLKTIMNNLPKGGRDKKRSRRRTSASVSVSERASTPVNKAEQLSADMDLLRQKLSGLFSDHNKPTLRGCVVGIFEVESVSGRSSAARSAGSARPGTASLGRGPSRGLRLSSVRSPQPSLYTEEADQEDVDDVFGGSPT